VVSFNLYDWKVTYRASVKLYPKRPLIHLLNQTGLTSKARDHST
jgi:hypothetical protein